MKISETTTYPHPILAPWSRDIAGGTISTTINFREDEETNQLSIHCNVLINQPEILALVDQGAAEFGCFIKCNETGFRRLQPLGFPIGKHDFAQGALLGRVQFRPMIWAAKAIKDYAPRGAHAEFNGGSDIEPGQIIAIDEEQFIDVTRPTLPSIESIFDIDSSNNIALGEFEVDTGDHRITVLTDEKTFALVQGLRQTDEASRTSVMNGLYVPVVMEILNQLRGGIEQFEQYRWLHPFLARCEQLGVDIESPSLLNDAQRLLGNPFAALNTLVDEELTTR